MKTSVFRDAFGALAFAEHAFDLPPVAVVRRGAMLGRRQRMRLMFRFWNDRGSGVAACTVRCGAARKRKGENEECGFFHGSSVLTAVKIRKKRLPGSGKTPAYCGQGFMQRAALISCSPLPVFPFGKPVISCIP